MWLGAGPPGGGVEARVRLGQGGGSGVGEAGDGSPAHGALLRSRPELRSGGGTGDGYGLLLLHTYILLLTSKIERQLAEFLI